MGALTPALPPKADSGSPFPLLLLKPAAKSEVKRAMETALTSGRLGVGEGTQAHSGSGGHQKRFPVDARNHLKKSVETL